jgi:hypothetical protein
MRDLRISHLDRFYLAFTPQTFFFLLLAANPSPLLRSPLPPICAHLVRTDSSYHPSLAAFLIASLRQLVHIGSSMSG